MSAPAETPKTPLREIVQPFIDVVRAPRALWGVNLGYLLEGLAYFGVLGYLAIYFSDFVFRGVEHSDVAAHQMVMVLTAGITIAMFFLGFVADRRGVRFALIAAFVLLLGGRALISSGPTLLGFEPAGIGSPLHLTTMAGILLVVVGYGMYQPAAYAAVRKFTTPATAGMGFAMLYALMNLGGFFPTFAFLIRDDDYLGLGMPGVFWVYTAITAVALVSTVLLLTPETVRRALAATGGGPTNGEAPGERKPPSGDGSPSAAVSGRRSVPLHMWVLVLGLVAAVYLRMEPPYHAAVSGTFLLVWLALVLIPATRRWLARHPLSDLKFFFFIFALIPVQTLFTYNWFILPQYISRAFEGWIGKYFEIGSNANPLLIFILVPIVAALTQKRKVYNMMILGTFVMAAPAFLLTLGPHPLGLLAYIVLMTIGEAMWQPRFLQYAAEIAPEGRTGEYMGVAQFPWFLTKVLVPGLYSGWAMERYCPAEGPKNTEFMWFIFGCIAICSTILLVLAKGWIGKDFKTKSA